MSSLYDVVHASGERNRTIIGNRNEWGTALSSGTNQIVLYRLKRWSLLQYDACAIQPVYSNTQYTSNGETAPPNSITIQASLEVNGVSTPVYFRGQRSVTLRPGEFIVADPMTVFVPRNSIMWWRTLVDAGAANARFPVAQVQIATGDGEGIWTGSTATAGVDLTGNSGAASAPNTFGPVCVLGLATKTGRPSVAIIGSSSAFGTGDGSLPGTRDLGYFSRLLGQRIGYSRLAVPGATLQDFLANTNYHQHFFMLTGVSHVIAQAGSNDLTATLGAGETWKDREIALRARLTQQWNLFQDLGVKLVQSTFTPVVTGSYTTLAGQTSHASGPTRQAINEWIRSKPHPWITAVLDPAAIVEDPTYPNRFRVDGGAWTTDGTHLSPMAHAAVAAALDRGVFEP